MEGLGGEVVGTGLLDSDTDVLRLGVAVARYAYDVGIVAVEVLLGGLERKERVAYAHDAVEGEVDEVILLMVEAAEVPAVVVFPKPVGAERMLAFVPLKILIVNTEGTLVHHGFIKGPEVLEAGVVLIMLQLDELGYGSGTLFELLQDRLEALEGRQCGVLFKEDLYVLEQGDFVGVDDLIKRKLLGIVVLAPLADDGGTYVAQAVEVVVDRAAEGVDGRGQV